MVATSFQVCSEGYLLLAASSPFPIAIGVLTFFVGKSFLLSEQPKFRWSIIIVALFFAASALCGSLLDVAGTLHMSGVEFEGSKVYSSPVAVALALFCMLVGYALFAYLAVFWAYTKMFTGLFVERNRDATLFGHAIDFRLCIIVLLVAWLPYFIAFFPGTVTSDTSRHLAQIFEIDGLTLDTHFPFLTGLIYSTLYRAGTLIDPSGYLGIFFMMMLQVGLGLFVFSSVVVWLNRLGMPRYLIIGALVFFALFPLVPTYIVSIGKDTLHALLIALFILQTILLFYEERLEKHYQRHWLYSPVTFGVCSLLIALTRNGGIIIALVGLIAVALLKPRKTIALVSLCVLVLYSLWQFIMLPVLGVHAEGPKEALSLPSQAVAACLAEGVSLDEEIQEALEESYEVPLAIVAKDYDPGISDNVKAYLMPDGSDGTLRFLGAALSLAAAHPREAFDGALRTTYGAWYPFCFGSFFRSESVPYVCLPDDQWAHPCWFASYENLSEIADRISCAQVIIQGVRFVPGVSSLYAPGTYFWLIVFLVGYAYWAKKGRRVTTAVVLPFFVLEAIMIAGPVSSIRYALPLVFALPILFSLFVRFKGDAAS